MKRIRIKKPWCYAAKFFCGYVFGWGAWSIKTGMSNAMLFFCVALMVIGLIGASLIKDV